MNVKSPDCLNRTIRTYREVVSSLKMSVHSTGHNDSLNCLSISRPDLNPAEDLCNILLKHHHQNTNGGNVFRKNNICLLAKFSTQHKIGVCMPLCLYVGGLLQWSCAVLFFWWWCVICWDWCLAQQDWCLKMIQLIVLAQQTVVDCSSWRTYKPHSRLLTFVIVSVTHYLFYCECVWQHILFKSGKRFVLKYIQMPNVWICFFCLIAGVLALAFYSLGSSW